MGLNHFRGALILLLLAALLSAATGTSAGQGQETLTLTVRLRDADGEPVAGEPVELLRLPEEGVALPACRTDATGRCAWPVARGLYQVLFARPLDDLSALALAEGGLRGFGLTVGGEDIAYDFTFHNDGHVYFDAAPAAARPAPVIPTPALLAGGGAPTVTPAAEIADAPQPLAAQGGADDAAAPLAAAGPEATAGRASWRFVLYLALGLAAGGALHLLRLLRLPGPVDARRQNRPARRPDRGKKGDA